MIRSINRIQGKAVLVDYSAFIAAVFTGEDGDSFLNECSAFLDYCAKQNIMVYVTQDAVTHLWKSLFLASKKSKSWGLVDKLPLSYLDQPTDRIRAFMESPIQLMQITPSIMTHAVEMWEQSKGEANIDACVALSAFQSGSPAPYVVVTANNHYDRFSSKDLLIMKPSTMITQEMQLRA